MRLKRLEVQGFKSFAIQTEFGFEPGLTGIVGPNGCGKSNVVDAIKWVLGETRPTSLRGSEMQDVIFKGTASRSPLGYAEVTLVLDNDSPGGMGHLMASGPSEVSLTRRLYRTGEGEYELNKQDVRRRDLKQLLAGTGLGVNAYSIMEQGKIDAVLSANALDRRAIFEEAAGITRFRTDRKEAIRRLESTEKDLESVRAVLNELERQRNSLRVQASRARKHQELADQLRGWRAASALYRFQERQVERNHWDAEVTRLQALESEARNARATAEEESAAARESARNLAAEQARVIAEHSALLNEEGRRSERVRAAREHAQNLDRAAEGKTRRSQELFAEHETLVENVEAGKANLASEQERLTAADAGFKAHVETARVANEVYRQSGRELDESQRELLRAIEARTSAQNALADLDAEDRATRSEDERLRRRLQDLEAELARLEPEHTAASARFETADRRAREVRESEAAIKAAREQAFVALSESERALSETEKKLSGIVSKRNVLRDLENSMAGVEAGAKAVIQAKLPGVYGLISNFVSTNIDYAIALDAALGRYASAVVTANRSAAASCLHFVRERKAGKLSVVVERAAGETGDDVEAIPAGEGVRGMLLTLMTTDPKVAGALRPLLGHVVVVENLEVAEALRVEHPRYGFVTLAGERVDGTGVTGGQREASATPIARKSTLTVLETDVTSLSDEREALAASRENARAALATARQAEDAWAKEMQVSSREANEAQLAFSGIQTRFQRIQSERTTLASEASEMEQRRTQLRDRRSDVESKVASATEVVRVSSEKVHELQVKRVTDEKARDEAAAAESTARVEAARLRGDVERLRLEVARREESAERTRVEAERLDAESKSDRERSQRLAADAADLEASIREIADQRAVLEARVAEIKTLGARQAEEAEEAVRRERERTAILEEYQSQLGAGRLELQRAAMICNEIAQRAREEANVAIEELGSILQLTAEFQIDLAEQKMNDLKSRLEKLGSVSSDATTELDSIESRFADLDRQRSDLELGKRSLQETIKELDTRCGERFMEAFGQIKTNFSELFRRLFRGGRADIVLQMSEGVDPLEAGVEIVAQPPGKKLQTISLLSGGERTLTALALLFAAFKTKPSPFCVLDEVDAALDDSNVERFLNMLEEFKGSTQFIVVTHHRRTMAACSALLGVTMPEQGVSQKVAVRLEDVDRVVPGAVGSTGRGAVAVESTEHAEMEAATRTAVVEIVPTIPRPIRGLAGRVEGVGPEVQ